MCCKRIDKAFDLYCYAGKRNVRVLNMTDGEMECGKCRGEKKIVVMYEWYGEPFGRIENCDRCCGTGKINDPDW